MRLVEHDSSQFGAWPQKNATGISGYLFDNQQATVLIEAQQQPKWSPIHWMSKLAALDLILMAIRSDT